MHKDINILIIDDDPNISGIMNDILSRDGYKIEGAESAGQAREKFKNNSYNIILLDLKLPDGSGLELLKEVKRINTDTIAIVFTGYASLESSMAALNEGAFAYIQKPLNIDELKITIKRALDMQQLSVDNKVLLTRLKELSLKDPLTGLYNYKYLRERLFSEFNRAKRYIIPLSIIMLDIDYFKSINDIYGHKYGDSMLKEFSRKLLSSTRNIDVVMRYGGEEFLILLPDTNQEGAIIVGLRLLDILTQHIFDPKRNKIKLKIAMGLSSFPENGVATESEFLDSVNKALRDSKEMGGNKLCAYNNISEKEVKTIIKKGGEENIDILKEKISKMEHRVNRVLLESIYGLAKTIEARDYYTGEHAESMVSIVEMIGKALKLPENDLKNLEHAAILHDLGKVGIPDNILHKKGKLTKKEFDIIKGHPKIGAEIIRPIHFLRDVATIILHHHERYDGMGYSSGLKGKEIPLGARIIAVADVYQALISDRPYRKAYSKKEALRIIKDNAGTHFDPEIVKVFMESIKTNNKPIKKCRIRSKS